MKKISLILSTTVLLGVFGMSSCGVGSKKSEPQQPVETNNNKDVNVIDYKDINIDLNYDDIFYTPIFQMADEDGILQPYVNKKYDKKIFFYSPNDGSILNEKFVIGPGGWADREFNLVQSIINSAKIHEIYLKNKELFNSFDFENKRQDINDSIIKPTSDRWHKLEDNNWENGNYHINIKKDSLTCTINAKTQKGKDFGDGIIETIANIRDDNYFAGNKRSQNWDLTVSTYQCQWFNQDLKNRFVLSHVNLGTIPENGKITGLWREEMAQFKNLLTKQPITAHVDKNGAIYDEWFKETHKEEIIEKDFWNSLNYNFDTTILSSSLIDNPRHITFATAG